MCIVELTINLKLIAFPLIRIILRRRSHTHNIRTAECVKVCIGDLHTIQLNIGIFWNEILIEGRSVEHWYDLQVF